MSPDTRAEEAMPWNEEAKQKAYDILKQGTSFERIANAWIH